MCGNTNPKTECYTASLQPPGVGGGIYLVRERQCWQKGHKKCRGRSTVTVPSEKKAVTTNVGGARARRAW